MSPPSRHQRPREIALAVRVGVPHLERVAHGIREYAKAQTNWRFLMSPETHDLPPSSLEGWSGDGVIALCNTVADERILAKLDCPVVNISGALESTRFPRVRNDYRETGARGARFLRKRGFERFGFYGVRDLWYSAEIEKGFCDQIDADFKESASVLHAANSLDGDPSWNEGRDELENWLQTIRPPFAVMAAHDPRAAMVIRACERTGLRVPQDVAVLGVNDDSMTCETCHPTLSSIERNGFEVGLEVAETLDRLLEGEIITEEIIVSPGEVNERESTQTFAIEDPALSSAVKFVNAHFSEPIGVADIVTASGKSRRWLETAFRKKLALSPNEFLQQTRVREAELKITAEPSLNFGHLAESCGFSGTRQLNAAFRQRWGVSVKTFLAR